MKKIFITIIIFACSLLNINAISMPDYNSHLINNIDEIIINVPSKVSLFEGDCVDINIRTKDIDLYNNIEYKIKNDVLYIDLLDYRYLDDQQLEPDDIKINIQVPHDIKKIGTNNQKLVAKVQKNNIATNHEKN